MDYDDLMEKSERERGQTQRENEKSGHERTSAEKNMNRTKKMKEREKSE